ncbi:MAG TPA: DUF6526 family protein [Thermoanaerobaculia bacterium]|nr:DUF6526 family protein [Thermoanaerobaculia bacterium]
MEQSYANHRRYHPLFHFIGFPILAVNVLFAAYFMVRRPTIFTFWNLLVAIALTITIFLARLYALKNQNRIIRLEETLRLSRCLPDDLKGRIGELRTDDFVGIRFCADEELPELCRAILGGEVTGRDAIKRRIRNWRADWNRI